MIGGMVITFAGSIIVAYIRTVGVTHYVRSGTPFKALPSGRFLYSQRVSA
jgi:hypothetical protein